MGRLLHGPKWPMWLLMSDPGGHHVRLTWWTRQIHVAATLDPRGHHVRLTRRTRQIHVAATSDPRDSHVISTRQPGQIHEATTSSDRSNCNLTWCRFVTFYLATNACAWSGLDRPGTDLWWLRNIRDVTIRDRFLRTVTQVNLWHVVHDGTVDHHRCMLVMVF